MDAADVTSFTFSSGSNISLWKDKSGFGNNFTTVSGTNTRIADGGYSVVSFPSGAVMSSANQVNLTTSPGIFIVCKVLDTGFNMILACTNITSGNYLGDFSIRTISGVLSYGNEDDIGNQNYYVNGTFNPSFGSSTYVNTYSIIDTLVSGKSGTTYFTFSSSFFSRFFIGNIAEFIFYPGGVSNPDRQQIEGYLAWKWGLQASLPGSHPYLAAAPLTPNALGITRAPAVAAIVPIPKQAMTALSYNASISPVTAATGIQLWLDASDTATTTVVAGKLTAWTDKSGKGCAVTVPATTVTYKSAFLNGRATLGFAGNANITTTIPTPPGNGDYAVIAVWKPYSGGTYAAITMGPASASPSLGLGYNGSYYNLFEWGQAESDYTAAAGSYVIQIGTRVGGVKTCYINGTAAPTGTGTLQNITNGSVSIGGGNAFYITGEIAEVIIYTGTLTTSQRQVLEGVLAAKWGLQASLPSFTGPTSITGCVAWFDAYDASYTTTGNTVTGWTNKTGGGNAVTGGGTVSINQATLNGKSSVRFPPGTNYLNTTLTFATNLRCTFYVMRSGSSTVNMSAIIFLTTVDTVGPQLYSYNPNDSEIEYNKNNGSILRVLNPVNYFDTTNFTSICTTTGNTGIWTNGSSQILIGNNIISNSWDTGSSTLTIGGHYQFSLATNTDIYELIQYDGTITTAQRQQLEGYLAWKWGLQAQLPTDHPYYISSPNHPYATTAPVGANLRAPAVAALVPTPTKAFTAIKKPIASLTLTNSGSTDSYIASYLSNGYVNSIARQAGTGADVGNGIATDTNGNIIITGHYSSNPFTLYTTAGSAFSTTLVNSGQTAFVAQYSSSGAVNWVARFSGSSVGLFCKTDSSNNIYVFGYFTSAPLTAYSSSGTAFGTTISTLYYFLVKYNSSGIIQWIANIGGTGQTNQNSLTCDTNGNVIVTCTGSGITPRNSDGTSYTGSGIVGAYRVNGFIVYYNTSGTIQWVATFAGGSRFWNQAISVDSSGNVYCSGYSLGGFAQPYNASGTGMFTVAGASGQNGYIVKYTSAGSNVSGTAYGGSGVTAAPLSQVTDSNADTTIVGTFTGTTFIAYSNNSTSQPFSNTLSNPGTTCGFIVKYNSSFVVQWTANIQAATGVATPTGVTCDSLNNIYVSVYTTGNVTIYSSNGSAATTITNTGTNTSFIVKFSSAGLFIWAARQSGGASTSQYLYGIVTDSIGNPYAVGAYTSAAGFVYSTGF